MSFTAIIGANVKDFEKGIADAQKAIDSLQKNVEGRLNAVGASFEKVGKKAMVLTGIITAAGGAAFKMAADFQDAVGATDTIFNNASKAVKDWADTLPSYYGIAKKEALEYANVMGSMLVNIGGLTQEQAAEQAATLISLAGDLTAMFGGTTQDAIRALTGSLKGNNTMLDNYGLAVNDAMVKARAYELGLAAIGEELSLTARQGATLSLIFEQTGNVTGQAAREADGASGSMRAFEANVKNLATSLGSVLLPVITPIITRLNEMLVSFQALPAETQRNIVLFAGIAAAIGPVLLIIGKLASTIPTLLTGLKTVLGVLPALKIAFTALTGPVGIIVAAIAAAAVAIIANWDSIKEYFTTGAGGEAFTAISELAVWLWNDLKAMFTKIKDFIVSVWSAIRTAILPIWENTFDSIMAVVDFFMLSIKNLANFFKGIVTLDFKSALEALKSQFSNIFSFIGRIVTNTLSGASYILADFLSVVGLKKWSASVESFALKMANAFAKPKVAVDSVTTAIALQGQEIAKTTEKVKVLSSAITTATAAKAAFDAGDLSLPGLGQGISANATAFTLPPVDSLLLDKSLKETYDMVIDWGQLISAGLADFAGAIGKAFGSGNFKDLGKDLISSLGSLATQFGSMLIGLGVAALQLQTLIANPLTAIAAGVALVALGAAATAAANKTVSNATGGGSSSYHGGAASYSSYASPAASQYRGQYNDDFTVNFKIGANELVGVLDTANNRRNRL